jgi:hypothetical protein
MIYDIKDILRQGAQYPPECEIKRRDGYRINEMLLDDDPWSALPDYTRRVNFVLSHFNIDGQKSAYYYDANYWQDLVEKMQELVYGDLPGYTGSTDEQTAVLAETITATEFQDKVNEGLADFVALGDWVTKVEQTDEGYTFTNVTPAMWYPIVSRENVKEIKGHVLAWLVPIDAKKERYELHVQHHEIGKYTNYAFAVDKYEKDAYYVDQTTRQKINCPLATLGKPLEESATGFELGAHNTGLDDFAIIASANNAKTRSIYGASDFDKITESAMEYNVRMTLKNAVLDKHSAPIMYGNPLAGEGGDLGNYLEVPPGGVTPNYLVWDASMQSVENTINKAQEDIANLSGLGSLLSSKTFGESQGYDALMIKLAPALMKTAKKRRTLERHLKKLLSLLSKGYGTQVPVNDIHIGWKDGIPATETVRADIAQKHLATGWSMYDVLTKDYGWGAEEAELAIERKREESPSVPVYGMFDENGGEGGE